MEEGDVKPLFTEEEFFDPVATRERIIARQIRDKRNKYCKENLRRILNIYKKVGYEQKRYIESRGRFGKEVLLNDYLKPEDLMCLEKYHQQKTKSTPIHTFELDDDDYNAKPVPLSPIVEKLKKQIKKHGPDDRKFDKSFRKISKKSGACGANRKKSTTRKKRRRRRRRKGRITFGGKRKNRKKRTRKYKKEKRENKIEYKLIKYMTLYLINDLVTRSNNRTNTILCARFSR